MGSIINMIGEKIGKLTVVNRSHKRGTFTYWECLCECSKKTIVRSDNLRSKHTKSCGCLKATSNGITKRYPYEYSSWGSMRRRCTNPKDKAYKDYGGRGIKVCNRWMFSFKNFIQDMGRKPKGYSIERINNNGNYEPSNCKWATQEEQNNNKRGGFRCRYLTFGGKTLNLVGWSRVTGLPYTTITKRLALGWSLEKALTQKPSRNNHPLTFNNKTKSTSEWAKLIDVPRSTLFNRVKAGWSVERALTTGRIT